MIDSGMSQVQLDVVGNTSKMTRHEARFGITSFIFTARRPFHPGRLWDHFDLRALNRRRFDHGGRFCRHMTLATEAKLTRPLGRDRAIFIDDDTLLPKASHPTLDVARPSPPHAPTTNESIFKTTARPHLSSFSTPSTVSRMEPPMTPWIRHI